jgi:uncharacterized membrane protein
MAAAGIFANLSATGAESAQPTATAAPVHCYGVDGCRGQNDCKTDKNACKGQTSCKGTGFKILPSAQDCAKAGGQVGS